MAHIPVLQKEVLEYLDIQPNENFIDCTIGGGGHTAAILKNNGPEGKVLGIEWDSELYEKLQAAKIKTPAPSGRGSPNAVGRQKSKIKNRLVLVNDNFVNLKEIIKRYNFQPIRGILLDLGMSSWHLENSKRGFSFQKDEILDMRYNEKSNICHSPTQPLTLKEEVSFGKNQISKILTAEKIVNSWSESEIEKILREYGEERFAGKIAKKIIEQRKKYQIKSTFQLLEIIKMAVPWRYCRQRIHFATKTFQALRIAVNSELENLKQVLPQALEILEPKGRIIVISFHSLEDRIAKHFFREKKREGLINILTKKPVRPTLKEISFNPRSRSAKLRAVSKKETALNR